MENIEEDTLTTVKCNNFESHIAYLLPNHLVDNPGNNCNKWNQAHISDTYSQGQGFVPN